MASPVADSHGLTVAWGTVALGLLTDFEGASPKVSTEDVSGITGATVVAFTDATGTTTHHGIVRKLAAGDITPGTVSINWIGANSLTWAMVGHSKTLTVTHSGGVVAFAKPAILMEFRATASVNALFTGTATFQLEGI